MSDESVRALHPNESAARVVPRPMEEMRQSWLSILARIPGDGLKGRGFPRNVLGELMHNPETFGPFLEYWVSCKEKMGLSVREQELVILRMAHLYRSNYVWKHHVPLAREFGVSEAELSALAGIVPSPLFSRRECALLVLTDELVEARTIRASVWEAWATVLKPSELIDLINLVSQYVLFALTNNALQVQIEETLGEIPGLI